MALINGNVIFPSDIEGTLIEVPNGPTIDNINYFANGGKTYKRVINGIIRATEVGLLATGADQTTRLQEVLNSTAVKVLKFDNDKNTSTDYTINGVVTVPTGKTIKFEGNNRLIGVGTIQGGIVEAGDYLEIFGPSLSTKFDTGSSGYVSARWWGAKPGIDATTLLQKAADYVVYSPSCQNLYIPEGTYNISKGILFWKDTNANGDPEFFKVHVYGASRTYTGEGHETTINCTHNNNFGFGFQKGKGVRVANIYFRGVNQLNYTALTAHNSATTYLVNGSRDNRYSPYAGIVIDPFGNPALSGITEADKYPGFTDKYTQPGNGGSTDFEFENIIVDGFTVAWICSPNGNTQNCESHLLNKWWISNCKKGIVTCNSQEREIICRDFKIWNSVKVCFSTIGYGYSRGDAPIIQGCNIAGSVYQIIEYNSFFLIASIANVHAESFRWIGAAFGNAVTFRDCHFNFAFDNANMRYPDYVYAGYNVKFENCNFFYYQGEVAAPFNFLTNEQNARIIFENCLVNNMPRNGQWGNWTLDGLAPKMINCQTYSEYSSMGDSPILGYTANWAAFKSGELVTYDRRLEYNSYYGSDYFRQERRVTSPAYTILKSLGDVTLTVTGQEATATIPSLIGKSYCVNKMVIAKFFTIPGEFPGTNMTVWGLGRIKSISGAGLVTFDNLAQSVVSGVYPLHIEFLRRLNSPTMGDVNGVNVTNVITEHSSTNQLTAGITELRNIPYFVESTTPTSMVLSSAPPQNGERQVFCNYSYVESGESYGNPLTNATIFDYVLFTKGARYKNVDPALPNEIEYLITKTGIKGTALPPEVKIIYGFEAEP